MIRKFCAVAVLLLVYAETAVAQYYPTQYRPPNQNWQYLKTPHFNLVYSQGNDSLALQLGQLMEDQYSSVQSLVGGKLHNFPIILNDYNDRSNGFVSAFHFRSEIEFPPIKGKSLNPQTGNWLTSVGPHELVHALQFNNLGSFTIPRLVSYFSPDLARSFHGAIPAGMLEGIAVHHETKNVAENGGRGNYPFFYNQFSATYNNDSRWSLGQMMHISVNTRPFNRHYIGGYMFTSWLQRHYGSSTTKEALDYYMKYPFLGYGFALRRVTGKWPAQLYDQFQQDQPTRSHALSTPVTLLTIPNKGREVRRPKWLSSNELIFYGSFYNARPGFYSYDLQSNKMQRLFTTSAVEDYQYDLSEDHSEMLYSYYKVDPIYDNTSKAELARYNFQNRSTKDLTNDGRMYAPRYYSDEILALQSAPASSRLVRLPADTTAPSVEIVPTISGTEIISIAADPTDNRLAVIANKGGEQALWITDLKNIADHLQQSPDISFREGSIFDAEWHPTDNRLMFSSDFSGIHQLYEYQLEYDRIIQMTVSPFNAFEGSYSPNGNRIAFIQQVENERLPAVLQRSDFSGKEVNEPKPAAHASEVKPAIADSILEESQSWETGSYHTGTGWLKPRTILPFVEEVSNRDVYQAGISLHSSNLLQNQSYSAEATYLQKRIWYELDYRNKTFFPGFHLQLASKPSYLSFTAQQQNEVESHTLLRQNRSLSLSIPLQIRLNQNIFSTSFYLEPEIRQSQMRFFELDGASATSDFAATTAANLYGQFNYRLQQNIRDLQPNSGATFYSELEHYFKADAMNFQAYNNNIRLSLQESTALQAGIYTYLSPLRKWNQSLRVSMHGITQSGLIFDNQSLVSEGFSEPVFPGSSNLLSFNTRYTVPLLYADDGGFLLPLYLSHIYLVGFSNTVTTPASRNFYQQSRSVYGVQLRTRFRLSNLSLDIGVGIGYEPTRRQHQLFIGNY